MLADLDKSLKEMLAETVNTLQRDNIRFEAPAENVTETRSLPALNLFLHDIRENVELRKNEWQVRCAPDGREINVPPPVRVECSYLITAQASDVESEHLLLGEVMEKLLRHAIIPEKFLQGSLKGQKLPLPSVSLRAGLIQSMGEFWRAMGGTPKAALHYTVTISVDPFKHDDSCTPSKVIEKQIEIVSTDSFIGEKSENLGS